MILHTESILEFDKIRNNISQYAQSELGKEACIRLSYFRDFEMVNTNLNTTGEMIFLIKNYQLPYFAVNNIKTYLKRAKIKNSFLNEEELISIGECLRSFSKLRQLFNDIKEQNEDDFRFINLKKINQ